jgi:hypothetical protein
VNKQRDMERIRILGDRGRIEGWADPKEVPWARWFFEEGLDKGREAGIDQGVEKGVEYSCATWHGAAPSDEIAPIVDAPEEYVPRIGRRKCLARETATGRAKPTSFLIRKPVFSKKSEPTLQRSRRARLSSSISTIRVFVIRRRRNFGIFVSKNERIFPKFPIKPFNPFRTFPGGPFGVHTKSCENENHRVKARTQNPLQRRQSRRGSAARLGKVAFVVCAAKEGDFFGRRANRPNVWERPLFLP